MKRHFFAVMAVLCLGMLAWAQGSRDSFDAKKAETEIEIMKGILGTTISHAAETHNRDIWRINTSNINAYYLVGQGAVFVIPASAGRSPGLVLNAQQLDLNLDLRKLEEQTRLIALAAQQQAAEIQKQAAEIAQKAGGSGLGSGVGSGIGGGIGNGKVALPAQPAPPAPPALPAQPAPPASPQIDREAIRKNVEGYREALKKSRADAAANQEKFLESLKEIRGHLIEALANYGDSLTQVKPGEYVNLILASESLDDGGGRRKQRYDIVSAQKSWIADYKAGRLSLENFKQKVVQYTQ